MSQEVLRGRRRAGDLQVFLRGIDAELDFRQLARDHAGFRQITRPKHQIDPARVHVLDLGQDEELELHSRMPAHELR